MKIYDLVLGLGLLVSSVSRAGSDEFSRKDCVDGFAKHNVVVRELEIQLSATGVCSFGHDWGDGWSESYVLNLITGRYDYISVTGWSGW